MVGIDEQPIIALCTPQGSGAIALLRLSGTDVVTLVDAMARLSDGKTLSTHTTHTIHHGHVIGADNRHIDEVLFLLMKAPKTFTGQDTIEISCHNNPFIIEQIIKRAIELGARQAQRGEFSKRAFLNKKIDLLQAQAISDLIAAQSELSLKKSMAQLKGTLSQYVQQIENELISLLSLVEASFEFLDEEQRDLDFDNTIRNKVKLMVEKTGTIINNFSAQQQIRQGIKIAIVGETNVGKSTLFNALVTKERAIVTSTPGTTRDAIETTVYQNGNFWLLIDTAGLRETDDTIEQKGIDRTWQEAAQSDIILLVYEAGTRSRPTEIAQKYESKVIMVANKIDQLGSPTQQTSPSTPNTIYVSAKEKTGIDELRKKIDKKIETLFTKANTPFLLNQRQHNTIAAAHQNLKAIESDTSDTIHYELIAAQLTDMLESLAQLTGKTINERVMDSVFKEFCVGK